MKHRITDALIWVVGTELVGAASAIVAGGGFSAYYASLVRPPLAPPGWLFPVAWAILYALMGLSAHLVHRSGSDGTRAALGLYAAQLLAKTPQRLAQAPQLSTTEPQFSLMTLASLAPQPSSSWG